jgi:hypothetical protein
VGKSGAGVKRWFDVERTVAAVQNGAAQGTGTRVSMARERWQAWGALLT